MKRLALVAAVLAISACKKADTPPPDASPAMAPAAAPAMAPMDTGAMKAMAADSARKADSVKAAAAMKKGG